MQPFSLLCVEKPDARKKKLQFKSMQLSDIGAVVAAQKRGEQNVFGFLNELDCKRFNNMLVFEWILSEKGRTFYTRGKNKIKLTKPLL